MTLRILFVPLMEKGHVHPLIGVMQQLERDGHALACFGQREPIAAQLEAAGISGTWFAPSGTHRAAPASASRTAKLRDPKWLLRWSALGITTSLQPRQVDELRAAIRAFAPDVVCIDPMAYPGCAAAELEGVPWAAISPLMVSAADPAWRCPWLDVARELQPMVLEQLRALGVTGIRLQASDVISPWLNTMFVTETFAPRAWSGNTYAWYLGPAKPLGLRGDEIDFPWERLRRDVPIVYVSSGGGQALAFEPETVLAIGRSISPDEAQLVCSLQHLYDDAIVRELPETTIAVRYAPQRELLESHAAIAVTHGGINSVTECLTYGRPMLVIPIGHEQPLQAAAVEARGVGLALDYGAVSAEACGAALRRLLAPSSGFRAAIAPIQASYAANGAVRAAELIATLGRTRQPLSPAGPS